MPSGPVYMLMYLIVFLVLLFVLLHAAGVAA